MICSSTKSLYTLLFKTVPVMLVILFSTLSVFSQNNTTYTSTDTAHLNPFFYTALKKPIKTNPLFAERIKPSKNELMYWPNYPLSAAQIDARQREWERKNNQPFGQQIASDIISNAAKNIIYGKKMPPATVPKF